VSEASLSEASLSDSSVSESTISDSTLSEESHAEAPENSTRLTSRPDSEDRPTLWSTVESVAEKVAGNASKAAQSVTAGTEEAIDYMSDGLGFSREDRPYQEPEPSRGLYVGNLFFDVTPAQLREEFEKAGKLVKAEIARDARGFSKGLVLLLFFLMNYYVLTC
jgi:RNA recognition motif-containing protein